MDKYPTWFLYFINCVFEEVLFRLTVIFLLYLISPNLLFIVFVSSLLYGLVHFIFFDYRMVIGAFLLGILLAFIYIRVPFPLNLWATSLLHFIVGWLLIKKGIIGKFERKG